MVSGQRPARHADHGARRAGRRHAARGRRSASTPSSCDRWEQLGISFDLFTTTGTREPRATSSQDIFLKLLEKGDIYEATMELPYCTVEGRFLLDRYVEGTCPNCGYDGARGDQCDNCGRVLDPIDLIEPALQVRRLGRRSCASPSTSSSGSAPTTSRLSEWLGGQGRTGASPSINWALGWIEEGLQDRAITRDIEWGVPIPVEGWDDKRIYVWFEAVIGYLSAAIEWAQNAGHAGRLARLLAGPGVQALLLHRQGQHPVPHADLAGLPDGLPRRHGRALQPALRRAGEPVPDDQGQQGVDEPRLARLRARLPRRATTRTRCATTSRR